MKPYKLPKEYSKWDEFFEEITFFCDKSKKVDYGRFANEVNPIIDSLSLNTILNTPVYCIRKQLVEEIKLTDVCDKSGILSDLRIAVPMLVLFVPENTVYSPTDKNDSTIKYIVIQHKEINDKTHKSVICWTAMDSYKQFSIGARKIRHDGGYLKTNIVENVDLQNKEEVESKFFALQNLILQVLMLLQLYPEMTEHMAFSEVHETKGFAKINHESQYRLPRWLGTDKVKRIYERTDNHSGIAKCPHVRSGHWRSQPHGKQNKERKTIWVRPVWVNYA